MMNSNVYIIDTKIDSYNNNKIFNPSNKYLEGININIKSDEKIYDEIRNLFITMKLDKKNIGTSLWNPFKDFIKEGNKVVIKPNLVKHINNCINGTTDSLITNFSIIRPIIDYCILALNGTGNIIVGDAPVQECDFDKVISINDLENAIKIYKEFLGNDMSIELIDFRKNNNQNSESTLVSIDNDSSFKDIDDYAKKYAITNYNLNYMKEHHLNGKHEYLISNYILNADVIINLPKPKSHRKAGMTACLKNFIGVNTKKEYLPHHRSGDINSNGDEFPEKSHIKNMHSKLSNYSYKHNLIINYTRKFLGLILKIQKKNRFLEGSWYGNDTIWRTILDINKIVLYSDKNGKLKKKKQRIIFNVADMIISGEKEGPLLPTDKNVGLIVGSFNSLNMDTVICQIMGFNPEKIKYINNGYKLTKYKISDNDYKVYDKKGLTNLKNYNKHFIPTDGWIDYLLDNNYRGEENK